MKTNLKKTMDEFRNGSWTGKCAMCEKKIRQGILDLIIEKLRLQKRPLYIEYGSFCNEDCLKNYAKYVIKWRRKNEIQKHTRQD